MLKRNPSDDPQHHYELGNLLIDMKNYPEALVQFRQAADLKPDFIAALIQLGNTYYALQDYNNAIIAFREVIQQEPDNSEARSKLSHLYGLIGNAKMQQYYSQSPSR